jgi:hypothetical protein
MKRGHEVQLRITRDKDRISNTKVFCRYASVELLYCIALRQLIAKTRSLIRLVR